GGYALRKGETYGTKGFWAPQLLFFNDTFYLVYVANEAIAVAKGSSPLGPFTQQAPEALHAPVKQIDPFVFADDDGKKYLYHVRLSGGNKLYVAELTNDLSAIKEETLKECITATSPWENTANSNWPVTEGPAVLKHKSWYYLFYTANDFRNPDYATGYAVANSPYGPWKKFSGNPIVSRKNLGPNGTGHGDFIKKGKRLFYVFHTHYSGSVVAPRRTAIVPVRFKKDKKEGYDKVVVDVKRLFYPTLAK
ncbi:MAG TPA: glycoside hydrolase family 43 protein, partial [Chitinophagaceae bacterium]|nr:glycoside hydrolase family 43 protein [Chitinophagaceae bacterium]